MASLPFLLPRLRPLSNTSQRLRTAYLWFSKLQSYHSSSTRPQRTSQGIPEQSSTSKRLLARGGDSAEEATADVHTILESKTYQGVILEGPKAARVAKLIENDALRYRDPGRGGDLHRMTIKNFLCHGQGISDQTRIKHGYGSTKPENETRTMITGVYATEPLITALPISLTGRIESIRRSGGKLCFINIVQDRHDVQVICSASAMIKDGKSPGHFGQSMGHYLRGDTINVVGHPERSQRDTPSLKADRLPTLLTPCISPQPQPGELDDHNVRMRYRHLDMLVNPEVSQTLRLRSGVIRCIRDFLHDRDFIEVNTPVLAASAGGASARPFLTGATELRDKSIALRIAPELWLKRMVMGGFDRVFEIGPVFRNEGIDKTHNPEYTTCEFYRAYASLDDLMRMTQDMLRGIADFTAQSSAAWPCPTAQESFQHDYQRLEFIPTIESQLGHALPLLHHADAADALERIFEQHKIHLPEDRSIVALLDKLCAVYIEPRCIAPTFVTHHPACMAPLAKSTTTRDLGGQHVSLRAELLINGVEMANMYEEQTSPFAQRAALVEQARARRDVYGHGHGRTPSSSSSSSGGGGDPHCDMDDPAIDDNYIEALQHGLPPTGGWGCGVDRLVMLFAGRARISDVLPFGTLRNVVALGNGVERAGQ